jgi:hypothetical protein
MMPILFYLFLNRDKTSTIPLIVTASLIAASIYLTHSLSAAVFLGITLLTLLTILAMPKTLQTTRITALYWAIPLCIGAILVSPFLVGAVPIYLNQSTILTSNTAVAQALIEHRTIPIELVLGLFTVIVAFFGLSKKIKGHFFSLPILLLISWLLVPLLLTQGHLVGLYVDAFRFQFFLIYPVMILLAVGIYYASNHMAMLLGSPKRIETQKKTPLKYLNKLQLKISTKISPKPIYTTFLIVLLIILMFALPIFTLPWKGIVVQRFYQVMDNERYQSIEWVKENTPEGSVFASDMGYGWWLAGFGEKPTLTDIDLQAISLVNEVDISRNMSYLLDTDYAIDNGYIQIREDGGYVNRHNPLFLVNLNWTNSPYGFFQFNSNNIDLFFHDENGPQNLNIADLPVTSMQLVNANSDSASIIVNRTNSALSYSEIITVTKGSLFANMTVVVQSSKHSVSLDWLNFIINSPGVFQRSFNNTIAILDSDVNECGQLIFEQNQPKVTNFNSQNPCITQLSYNLQNNSSAQLQILVGIFAVSKSDTNDSSDLDGTLKANLQNPATAPDLPLTTFDYKIALQRYNISYIANLDFELNRKYAADPGFSLAFMNDKVAIYKVETNTTQSGGS